VGSFVKDVTGYKMEYLYVLQLEGDRYYVGKTTDMLSRFILHMKRRGASFTRKYRVLGVDLFRKCYGPFDEDTVTKEYMYKYGIDNVRGGSYTTEYLEEYQIMALEKELCTAYDKCYLCKEGGHLYTECDDNELQMKSDTKILYDRWLY
jgi:cellular nucleic acid-binding protein